MIKLISSNGNIQYNVNEYVCDTLEELENLPKNCAMGSTCIVISTSELYMMNGEKKWVKL